MNAEMEPVSNLSPELITRSLNFHGQLLQKTWEAERSEGDLQKLNVNNLDFAVYTQRQKHLSFQDRGKRLKLHQFISKRANILFDPTLIEKEDPPARSSESGHFAMMPAFETFLNLDKTSRAQHFLQSLRVGDVIISSITNKANSGLVLKVLCVDGETARSLADLNIKAFCPTSNLISAVDKKNIPRSFMLNDLVACEVLEVIPDAEKIICGMKGVQATEHKARLGLFHSDDFPEAYKLSLEAKNEPYEEMLEKTIGFHNPSNVACLSSVLGLGNHHHTNILALKGRFPEMEYASELRTVQAAKWAFRSVADGIEHFKAGRQTEAFQCLNKALSIDPSNIEGLVARGALFANSGGFKKAIDDFECALKLNPGHANARKYLGETLVAFGRNHEDQGKMDEALKCYEKCLEVVPFHEEAHNSIEFIKVKLANGSASMTDGLVTAGLTKTQGVKDTLKQLLGSEQVPVKEEAPTSAKKKKKEKKAKKHKRHSSSSSSSSSSGSSTSTSSSTTSDTSSATSNDSHRKKKHKSRKGEPKEKSLSPLSKRMAIMDSTSTAETDGQRGSHYNPPAMPYSFSSEQTPVPPTIAYPMPAKTDKESEYEQRVCKFLEQTKGDSDYEEKVRKFLDETAKWKKERKNLEEKAKKKRKKEKKARSKSKKKKREERKKKKMLKEIDEKKLRDALRKQRRRSNVEDDEEFLYGEKPDLRLSLPDLEDLQSKLSYYVKVEKGNSSKKKEKSSSVEKLVAAAQAKAKASSPKMLYLHDEEKEESRLRKLEKKKMDMFEESSPPQRIQDAKNVPLPSAPPPPSSSKFKMQIGSVQQRLKKRGEKNEEKETWDDVEEKRFIYMNEGINSAKEPEPKKLPDKKKEIEEQMAKTPMILDKLGGFRINPLNAEKKMNESDRPTPIPQKRKLRSRVSESDSSDSDVVAKKKDRGRSPASSRSRSRSRSHKKYSSESPPAKKYSSSSSRSPSYRKDRSRSKSGSYRSRSSRRYRSSESGSYRRSYSRSRSRSRSMDYHRRSRSRSDDRHHYRKYPGRYPRNRGTYYRPRFQTGFKTRPGGFFPRGGRRGGPWRPGGRPFIPRMRGRGRPRFFHYNNKPRDDRYRRYDRDMSRSDDDDGSPMRKVDAAKERIDRMLSEDKRHTGPLSEGEERDDDYIDRKDYERERSSNVPRASSSPEMERSKKEGSKERSKGGSKPNPW